MPARVTTSLANLVFLLAAVSAGAQSAPDGCCGRYLVRATSAIAVALPKQPSSSCYYRTDAGQWEQLPEVDVTGEQLLVRLSASELGSDSQAALIVGKPDWMVLEDNAPPRLLGARVNGEPCTVIDGSLHPAPVRAGDVDMQLEIEDEKNPLSVKSVRCVVEGLTDSACRLDLVDSADALARKGRMTVAFRDVPAGAYQGDLRISDLAPEMNQLRLRFVLNVIGINISPNRRRVTLASSAGQFVFQAGREQQLQLPGGTWAKLTTRIGNTWLYPHSITDIKLREGADGTQGVLITADVQDIEGKEVKGLGMLEYDLRIRLDTPALFVTTRSTVIAATPKRNSANWGWLPAAYYATPEGKMEWRGLARNAYVTIGNVGWIWLAPKPPNNQQGLVWISGERFGESRFNTMLLYGVDRECSTDEYVEMSFAIAPASTVEQAQAIHEDLARRRLIHSPAGGTPLQKSAGPVSD